MELLYWDGCPSHPEALVQLREALDALGHRALAIEAREVSSDEQAVRLGFVGSPTIRVDGVDPLPPPPDAPAGLTCRVYRLADGRFSPTPDPDQLRAGLRRLLGPTDEERST